MLRLLCHAQFLGMLVFLTSIATPAISSEQLRIFDDEHYRQDGALTRIDTCLAIADDDDAYALSDNPIIKDAIEEKDGRLLEVLRNASSGIREREGFGTLFACAQIVAAWYARTGQQSGVDDGREVHGTLVIDLDVGKASSRNKATIKPVSLVRLLSSPRLLPPAIFGGIVIRNAIIEGPLVFHNVHLSLPLAFADSHFYGGDYKKHVYGIDASIPKTAITIINSKFSDHVQISNSQICGMIRIVSSHLQEQFWAFDIGSEGQGIYECRDRTDPDNDIDFTEFKIVGSKFDQDFTLLDSKIDYFDVDDNEFNQLLFYNVFFGDLFKLKGNSANLIEVKCSSLANKMEISNNHIARDLFVYGPRYGESKDDVTGCADWWRKKGNDWWPEGEGTQLTVSSNVVAGGLGVIDLDGSTLAPEVDLQSNQVGNGSEIEFPISMEGEPWHGVFDLQGSSYRGTLEIKAANNHPWLEEEPAVEGDYCPPRPDGDGSSGMINLAAADIRILRWDLPLNCKYRWRGYGLTYDLWLAGEAARASVRAGGGVADQLILPRWRQTLDDYDAASLSAMSDYLAGKGSSVESRQILVEAKRLNYAPECPPDRWTLACLFLEPAYIDPLASTGDDPSERSRGSVGISQAIAAQDLTGTQNRHDDVLTRFTDVFWQLSSKFKLFLLWPSGFGATPETALYWILVCILVCYGFYAINGHYFIRRQLKASVSPKRELNGFRDLAPPDLKAIIGRLADGCPTDDDWIERRPKERLIFLNELTKDMQKSEDKLTDSATLGKIRGLRRDLERFGNTERLGFSLFDLGKEPVRFSYLRYSVDAMLPFIDLHAYNYYYPNSWLIRLVSVTQHVLGWWWLTVFIASAAIL